MDVEFRRKGTKWVAEVWENLYEMQQSDTMSEERYVELNNWCVNTFGYHSRTAYHIFEFKKRSDLNWFILMWT